MPKKEKIETSKKFFFSKSKNPNFTLNINHQKTHIVQMSEHEHELGPLITFINIKSGGRQGSKLKSKLQKILGEKNVFDLIPDGPEPG